MRLIPLKKSAAKGIKALKAKDRVAVEIAEQRLSSLDDVTDRL